MSEIPDDIMRLSADALLKAGYSVRIGDDAHRAIAKAINDAVVAERERIVLLLSDQAAAMAEMSIHGLAENSRVREAMEAALTGFAHIIRAAKTPPAPKGGE